MFDFQNHELDPSRAFDGNVRYEQRTIKDGDGKPVDGLYAAWITLDNPEQLNAYTTEMVKDVILAFRRASEARDVVAVVFTGAGNKAFCTGGNTKEYAEYYAGRPDEYRRYMRLFNDMVTTILHCERPVVCRVNGMRIAGGQEIGMACDFTLASDLAVFGQAGPKHGSAPDGGSTDFLPLFVGVERAMQSATLCDTWSAYQAVQYGLITKAVPALKVDGKFIPSPMVVTNRMFDEIGRPVYGTLKTGQDKAEGKALLASGTVDLSLLDEAVSELLTRLLLTMPGCLTRTVESVRKHKLAHWDKNREGSRSWLGLNMLGEAHLGFRAFNEGPRGKREVDFVELRRRLAAGEVWSKAFIDSLIPK